MTCRRHTDDGFAGTKKPEAVSSPEDAREMQKGRNKTEHSPDKKWNVVVMH